MFTKSSNYFQLPAITSIPWW